MTFEDAVGYFIIFAVFVIGFLPLMVTLISDAQVTADPKTDIFLGLLPAVILIIYIVSFFKRMSGEQTTGQW
jgi:hypothetical protein